MTQRKSKIWRYLILIVLVIVTGSAGLVWAIPGAVACALVDQTPLVRWSDYRYAESADMADHERYDNLLVQARSRVSDTYGEFTSSPHIVFFDSAQPVPFYKPNMYGSIQIIGNKTCIFIGPKGQNVDVVSHELVHADVFTILGPYDRRLHMPMWLDEGLAMQVDYRPQYTLAHPDPQELSEVGSWNTYSEFFDAPGDGELANRYALAKSRVERWVGAVGTKSVYASLKELVSGGMSEESRNAGLTVP